MKDIIMQHGDEKGKVFVGGLSWNTNNSSMLNYFSNYGEVIDCVVMKNPGTGKSRGFGFVTFKEPACVDMVLSSKCHVLDGRQIDPKACNPRSMNKGSKSLENSKKKIFIGGLPVNVTEEELVEHFSKYGSVIEVVIMLDQQKQRSRGFGFLTFDSEECVEKVVQEHFIQINGKQVEVKKAEPRDMKLLGDSSSTNSSPCTMPPSLPTYPVFLAPGPPGHFNIVHMPSAALGQPILAAPPTNAISLISPMGLASTHDGIFGHHAPPPATAAWCCTGPGLHLVNPSSSLLLIASDGSGNSLAMTPSPSTGMAYQVWPPMQASMNDHMTLVSPNSSEVAVESPDRMQSCSLMSERCNGDMPVLAAMYHFGEGGSNGLVTGSCSGSHSSMNSNGSNSNNGSNIFGIHQMMSGGLSPHPTILAVQRAHASTPAGFHPYRR